MLLIQPSPPFVRTHTSNPAFPTGGGWDRLPPFVRTATSNLYLLIAYFKEWSVGWEDTTDCFVFRYALVV